MNIALIYYSGAGNTKFIARHIHSKLKDKSHTVTLVEIGNKPINIDENSIDLFVLGFPVYDLVAPKLVKQFVANIKPSSKAIAYFCTKAFMSVDAIKELSDISTNKGLTTVACLDLFMPGTDLLAFVAKKNSGTEKLLKRLHSRKIGAKIDRFITRMEKNRRVAISKKWYTHLSFLIPTKSKEAFHAQYTSQIPQFNCLNDVCTHCMLCVKACPHSNIQRKNEIEFGVNCAMCLKCLHHCPVEAIQVGKATVGKVRYKKIEIEL